MSLETSTFVIELSRLHFFGYHGLYQEERILGNEFEVNIKLYCRLSAGRKVSIDETINYAAVYKLVKQIFAKPEDLLETVCLVISDAVKERFPQTKKISIQITKLHPPITAFTGSVGVRYKKRY